MSQMGRLPLLLNPRARSERARRARHFVVENLTRFAVFGTRSAEEAQALARKFAEEGERVVVAAGGDGTLNAVVQGLAGTETALGVLPTGTMNVFARELGIPLGPFGKLEKALEVIDAGHVIEVDLFEANRSPFLQMAGVGFDAKVIEETSAEQKKRLGPLAYLLSALKVLGDDPPRMVMRLDGGREVEGVCALAGNGSLYGGQFRLFKHADNRDGLLDVVVFKEAGYRFVRDSLRGLAKGGFRADSGTVEYCQTAELEVECGARCPWSWTGTRGEGTPR